MNLFKSKYRLIVKTAIIVLPLIAMKAIFHFLNLEINCGGTGNHCAIQLTLIPDVPA